MQHEHNLETSTMPVYLASKEKEVDCVLEYLAVTFPELKIDKDMFLIFATGLKGAVQMAQCAAKAYGAGYLAGAWNQRKSLKSILADSDN